MSDTVQRMGRSMMLVTAGILLSRVLGLVRDIVLAHAWGTSTVFAGFVAAFAIPNLLRALFGEGAFSAAFVPMFSESLEKRGKADAWQMGQRVISVLAVVLAAIVIPVMLLAQFGHGTVRSEAFAATLRLLPWVMPYALLICLTGALAAVLNALNRFAIPSVTPVLLNVTMILTALFVSPLWPDAAGGGIIALCLAVLLAGVLQLAMHLVGCARQGLRLRLVPDWNTPDVRRMAWLMAPALVGISVAQLNSAVDKILALMLGGVATSSLYYSQRLIYLPVGLFGVSMAVVCLPAMSRAWARNEHDDMMQQLVYGLRHVLFLSLPTAALLSILAGPVVRLLFERGSFTALSTAETVWALAFYLPGIPAFACAKIAATPFYARQDTRTPVRIAALCLVLNLILNLTLMWPLRQGGLALATTITSYLNVALLLSIVHRQFGGIPPRTLGPATMRIAAATVVAALATWLARHVMPLPAVGFPLGNRLVAVFLPLALGGLTYLAAALALGCTELRELTAALSRRAARHPQARKS